MRSTDMAEEYSFTGEESEQMKDVVRRMDARMGDAAHYGCGEASSAGRNPWESTRRTNL